MTQIHKNLIPFFIYLYFIYILFFCGTPDRHAPSEARPQEFSANAQIFSLNLDRESFIKKTKEFFFYRYESCKMADKTLIPGGPCRSMKQIDLNK